MPLGFLKLCPKEEGVRQFVTFNLFINNYVMGVKIAKIKSTYTMSMNALLAGKD